MPTKLVKDFEVDLETLGRGAGCVVLSIGAVCVDETGLGAEFYSEVSIRSCIEAGLQVEPATLEWWRGQGKTGTELLARCESPKAPGLGSVVDSFCSFVELECGSGARPWGNGASFDIPIIEAAIRATGRQVPWKFWDHRCHRTMRDHWLPWVSDEPFVGTKHHALQDARHQAKHLHRIMALRAAALAELRRG